MLKRIFTTGITLTACLTLFPLSSSGQRDFTEQQRKAWNKECDREGLLQKTGMVFDKSDQFIMIPENIDPEWMGNAAVAKTPPTIEFAPVRGMEPRYFPEDMVGYWSDFGDVVSAPNGRFYFAVGDHRGRDGKCYAFEYDPISHNYSMVIDFSRLCGWDDRGVGNGKIHGEMGAMPDGNLWILTYWDPMPWSTEEDYAKWPGSHIVKYDTFSGRAQDLGIPVPKCGWPYYTLDKERGNFVAVGFRGEILCYNVKEERVTYAGYPPPGIKWWVRCTMLDPETGIFWSCMSDPPYNFVSFNPATNEFVKYETATPNDLGRNAGKNSVIRGHTERRTQEGFIWVNSTNGTLYKFWPDEVRTEVVTMLWGDFTYVPRISLSPDERFLYYVGNTKRSDYHYRPLVQFNTKTYQRKVLAFIADYYYEKYGYVFGSMHGSALSHDGKTFVMVFNGSFLPRDVNWQDTPSLVVLHIPESER